ncbi:tRNA pseudouridine(13) synthase TruD [Zhongshania sp.]|uniref:tRNA pseudouridine(13) synthase TruD n=1 Tax=Zhongshania sp. TaxID=1971902 RepID=UPI0035695805
MNSERRALRLIPRDFQWRFTGNKSLELSFSLPRGCFATALVRELISYPLAS